MPLSRRTAAIAGATGIVLLAIGVAWAGTGYRFDPYIEMQPAVAGKVPTTDKELKQLAARLDHDIEAQLRHSGGSEAAEAVRRALSSMDRNT